MSELVPVTNFDKQMAILDFLASRGSIWEPWYMPFAPISDATDLGRREVRRLVRALKRKGYADFSHGLMTEDGEFAGSGYAITKAGRDFLAATLAAGERG